MVSTKLDVYSFGVVLLELRPADSGGLEELFRTLTSEPGETTPGTPTGNTPVASQIQEVRA